MNLTTLNTSKSLSGSFLGLGDSLLKIATILSVAVVAGATVALVAITKLAISGIKQAAELEQQIANIAAVMGVTGEQAGFLKTTIMDLGLDPRLKATTFEAAEAIELLAKNGIFAGMTVEQMASTAKDAATAVIMLSNATGADFGQAANIATSAMILFGEEASDLVDIVSGITGVTTTSKLTIDDYELALRNGGAAVAEFGVELSDFNTMVAISAEELGTGMKVGTGWLNFMNRLTPNTEKASDMMKQLGLMTADGTNRFFDANGELKDMTEISKILNEVLYGTTKVVSEVSNRTAEQNAMLADLNAEYSDAKATIAEYTTGVSGLLATEDEKNKAISEAQAIIDKISPAMAELNGISSDYVTTLQNLTTEQRMVAIETLFGNDGMKSAIALAKEGARTTADYTEIMNIFGVDSIGAYKLIAGGLTDFEVAQRKIENVDGIQAAITRMDTLKGKMEIIGGVMEALKISFGDPLVVLFGNLADKAIAWWEANKDLQDQLKALGQSFADLFESLINGEGFMDSFTTFLEDVGGSDVADKFTDIVTSIQDFIDPIREFVEEHAVEFEGALKGIGAVLATAMAASLIMGIAGALWALVNPATALIAIGALLGAAWAGDWGEIQGKVQNIVDALNTLSETTGITSFIEDIKKSFSEGGLQGVLDALPKSLETLGSKIGKTIKDWFSKIDWVGIGSELRTKFLDIMGNLGTNVGTAINFIVEWLSGIDWVAVGDTLKDFFIGALLLMIAIDATIIEGLFNFFKGIFETVDWAALGTTIKDMIFGLLTGWTQDDSEIRASMIAGITDVFNNVSTAIETWFTETDTKIDSWVDTNIIQPILNSLSTFSEDVKTTLGEWWLAFNTWVQEVTWQDIGYWITTAILNVLFTFPLLILSTLAEWWTSFYTWFTETDWTSLGNEILTKIDTELQTFWAIASLTLGSWWTNIQLWFTTTNWKSLAKKVITDLDTELKTFWAIAVLTVNSWWTDIQLWFTTTNWNTLGESIMDGIIDGITNKLESAKAAILGIAEGVKEAWDDFWDSHSPSRVMMKSGQDIMTGATVGVMKSVEALTSAMSFAGGSAINSFADTTANILPHSPNVGSSTSSSVVNNNYALNNSFAGNPQITDVSQLEMTLAGYR